MRCYSTHVIGFSDAELNLTDARNFFLFCAYIISKSHISSVRLKIHILIVDNVAISNPILKETLLRWFLLSLEVPVVSFEKLESILGLLKFLLDLLNVI